MHGRLPVKILKDSTFSEFSNAVQQNNCPILCYGTGLVAQSIEDIFQKARLDKNIYCFIDGNPEKYGTCVKLFGRELDIKSICDLRSMDLRNKVLLLTLEAFSEVIENLGKFKELENLPCYIFTELNRSCAKEAISKDNFCKTIPKIIHYCWFGNDEIPPEMEEFICSWSKHNSGYQIIRWDESNYDVCKNNYARQAYEAKKYAFASDFARMDILYEHGGIYLDTDVEVLKNFDCLLHNTAFIAYNEWPMPNSAIIGSIAGLDIIRRMRDTRSEMNFLNPNGTCNLTINSVYEADVLTQKGFKKDFTHQVIDGLAVYPPCFFPQEGRLGLNADIDERTFAVHYALGSWKNKLRGNAI
jgi:hypothetical protein